MDQKTRIGIIGLGYRGMATLRRYMRLDEALVTAVADTNPSSAAAALAETGDSNLPLFSGWQEMAKTGIADLYLVCTPPSTHAAIACGLMEIGCDVAVEVPAAITLEECRRVHDTVLKTGRFFTMLENCCFDPFALNTEHMVREGLIGEIVHCEGAYVHDLRWRPDFMETLSGLSAGNSYPTHGLGPICKLLDIGAADTLDSVCSLSASCMPGSIVNTSIISTRLGRSILLQLDLTTPRPYSRRQTVCGTKGYVSKYPLPTLQFDGSEALTGDCVLDWMRRNEHPWVTRYRERAEMSGADNLMNYIMDCRLLETYSQGLPPDISAPEAVLWSSLAECTAKSAEAGGKPVKIPRFS